MCEKLYEGEKILLTRNCRRRLIKNLLPEKRNENMKTKQPRFKTRLDNEQSPVHRIQQHCFSLKLSKIESSNL